MAILIEQLAVNHDLPQTEVEFPQPTRFPVYPPLDRAGEGAAAHDPGVLGAILDTIWEEPLPASSPLWDAPGLIITPHTSWSSGRVLDRSIELFCDNLVRYRDGREMLNLVDPEAGY